MSNGEELKAILRDAGYDLADYDWHETDEEGYDKYTIWIKSRDMAVDA